MKGIRSTEDEFVVVASSCELWVVRCKSLRRALAAKATSCCPGCCQSRHHKIAVFLDGVVMGTDSSSAMVN